VGEFEMPNVEVSAKNADAISKKLESAINEALGAAGLSNYQIETLILEPKSSPAPAGLLPGCYLHCEVRGFPPKVHCEVRCG
jgi:hypothetical protein